MKLLNAKNYIENFLKIRTKDGKLQPLRLNEPQRRLYEAVRAQWQAGRPVRIIILKARQMGFSTLTEAMIFWRTATAPYTESMIVAHTEDATSNLFRMSRLYLESLPPQLRPMTRSSNAQELDFNRPTRGSRDLGEGLHSRIRCATAGGSGVGRSYTLQCLHLSEFAFWPGKKREIFSGLAQAVPDQPGTMIVIESTANGYDEFKELWDAAVDAKRAGEEGFEPIFFPWFELNEYRREVPPGFQRTEEEDELARRFGLDDEQLSWRRWCILNQCGGDVQMFHQEYPSTPDEAFVSTGQCFFPQEAVAMRREAVRTDVWERGRFVIDWDAKKEPASWRWEADPQGPVQIRAKPEPGVPYVIGGDTAGEGSDFFAGQVLDNRTGEQVAKLHHRLGERAYAEQMYCLGMYYNEALIGIETNFSTYPELKLEELGYRNLYVRERFDSYSGKTQKAFGFATTSRTRQTILDGLKDVALHDLDLIADYDTLGEMLTFVRDEDGKVQAEEGKHDDLVMALAIAHHIRGQQRTSVETTAERAQWTRDQWEDYNAGTPEEREQMIKLWGEPR